VSQTIPKFILQFFFWSRKTALTCLGEVFSWGCGRKRSYSTLFLCWTRINHLWSHFVYQ